MISGIIKVSARAISLILRPRPSLFQVSQKPYPIIVYNASNLFARTGKLGNIWEYSSIFKTARVAKKIWRIIKTIASIWGENMSGYLSLDIWPFSCPFVFLKLRSRKTVRFSEQILSAGKYPSIFSRPNVNYCFLIRNLKNWVSIFFSAALRTNGLSVVANDSH